MGVWIETGAICIDEMFVRSHPVWVCGLKLLNLNKKVQDVHVTPCMGVWIETQELSTLTLPQVVTPCMGVWIETKRAKDLEGDLLSHPVWVCGLKR